VSPILIVFLNTNCKPRYSVTNTKCWPNIICRSLWISWGIIDLHCCNTVTYRVVFHPNVNHPWHYFITSCSQKKVRVLGQWVNSFIIHNNIGSLMHQKCHPKSYHNGSKYHMTLNIIFIVVDPMWDLQLCDHRIFSKFCWNKESFLPWASHWNWFSHTSDQS
jgi:hypothetical protein